MTPKFVPIDQVMAGQPEPPTSEERLAIRARHHPTSDGECHLCAERWPCDAKRLRPEVERLTAERDDWQAKYHDAAQSCEANLAYIGRLMAERGQE